MLDVKLDWLSFTIFSFDNPFDVIEFMGFDSALFVSAPRGASGYKHMLKYETISVLYDGSTDMGIHVDCTGSSVGLLLESYSRTYTVSTPFGEGVNVYDFNESNVSHFVRHVLEIGQFTRLDIALDNTCDIIFGIDEIRGYIKSGRCVSKWRTSQVLCENVINDFSLVGNTLYFGSKQSDIQLRIYDKRLERNKSLSLDSDSIVNYEWLRWELQLRGERCKNACDILTRVYCIGSVFMGILANYLRFINLDDSNKSRCSTLNKWDDFIGNVSKLRLTVIKELKSLDEERKSFERQQGRKIAKMFYAMDGDLDYFMGLVQRFECRLTLNDLIQLGLAIPR